MYKNIQKCKKDVGLAQDCAKAFQVAASKTNGNKFKLCMGTGLEGQRSGVGIGLVKYYIGHASHEADGHRTKQSLVGP